MATTPDNEALPISEERLNPSAWRKRSALSFLLALAILAFFAARLEVNFQQIWESVRSANPLLAIAGFFSYYMVFPLRALRWRILLTNMESARAEPSKIPSWPALSEILFLSWFVNCVMPAKLGDAYRAYQYKRATQQGSLSSALGTIFAERFMDVVVLVVLLITALLTLGGIRSDSDGSPTNIVGAGVALLFVGSIGLATMWLLRNRLPGLMPQRVRAVYSRFQHGILSSFGDFFRVIPLSFLVWTAEIGRVYFVVQAMNLGLPPGYVILLALTQALLSVVPFTPGGLGLVETGMVGLLLFAGIPRDLAVATALVDRTISYWSLVILGFIVFVLRRKV